MYDILLASAGGCSLSSRWRYDLFSLTFCVLFVSVASAYASLQQHGSEGVHGKSSPVAVFVPRPDYLEGDEDTDLIKPKKLVNPVKASKSHQELHRELLSSYKR